jgi:hypothetical protein
VSNTASIPCALVAVALAVQMLIDPYCTFGATTMLELGAIAGITLYGCAIGFEALRLRTAAIGRTKSLWWVATLALTLIALVVNRKVWSEMLSAKPCGPIEYEDGVRYRASHAVIGIGYGLMPLLTAVFTIFGGFWRGSPRPSQ